MAEFPDGFEPRTIEITREDLRRYADASGDHNPIHLDDEAARALGLEGVIAHGMLTWARVVAEVAAWAGGMERIVSSEVRFANPVPVPSEGAAKLEIAARIKDPDPTTGNRTLMLTVTCGGAKVYGKAQIVVSG